MTTENCRGRITESRHLIVKTSFPPTVKSRGLSLIGKTFSSKSENSACNALLCVLHWSWASIPKTVKLGNGRY